MFARELLLGDLTAQERDEVIAFVAENAPVYGIDPATVPATYDRFRPRPGVVAVWARRANAPRSLLILRLWCTRPRPGRAGVADAAASWRTTPT